VSFDNEQASREFVGVVRARHETDLGFRVAGKIVARIVNVGDRVSAGDVVAPFQIDDYTRWRLLEGLDDIGITLSHEDDVAAFETRRPSWKPATL